MRWIENVGFLVAVLVALIYGAAEALHVAGVCRAPCQPGHDFPWGLFVILVTLALPKLLGRATAGRIWDAIAQRIGGKAGTP